MKKIIVSLIVSSVLLTGCASNKVSEDKYSGFLSDYSILKTAPDDKDTLGYVAPNIDWEKYNSGMVDRVVIITPDGDKEVDSKLLVAIAEKFEEMIKADLKKHFNIVDRAGPGTIRVQAAITGAFSSYDDLKGYQYIPIAAAVVGGMRASGAEKKSVRVMAEVKLLDAVDGQLLAQAVDLKAGGKKQSAESGILLADVKEILKQWSQRITDRIVSLKKAVQKKYNN